ncbi:MAG: hypothetical protein EZS28_019449 [Streblomastix strix]|uniref:Right handed beta helix domain-containing protein n=1 Tax=Streblomastix strix TaxID=222440 RepID=A0A5J4VR49_9EUKA|nr:MAG: hypothetical protein EZS28_019449 [Streblomastix strix]
MQIILLLFVSVALCEVFAPLTNIASPAQGVKSTNDACSWKVSRSQTGDDIKNSVSQVIAAICESEEGFDITLLDSPYREDFSIIRTIPFVIRGTTTEDMQTTWMPEEAGHQCTINLLSGHMTLQNIDFPFVLFDDVIAPTNELINVYGGSSSRHLSLTLNHCNFNGLGLKTESYNIQMISIGASSTIIIDDCTFSDIFSRNVVISASSFDSISIKNSRFTDIKSDGSLSGAILIQAGNDDNYDIEITGNTFTNIVGNRIGTVGVLLYSDEDEGFLKFNRNTIKQCSGNFTGGFYVQYGSFSTIELNSNTFIGNDFTGEVEGKAADGYILKNGQSGITDAVSYFKGLFAGSTSDKINSIYYEFRGGSSGYFTPDLPLPCQPTQTAAECACIDGDTRDVCKTADVPISIIDCTKTPDNDACIGECKDNTKKTEAECACIVGDKREICKGKSAVGSLRVTLSLIVAAVVLPAIALY